MRTEQTGWCDWHDQLEIVGAAIFLRYRKRLNEPGILWAIRSEQAGLSLLDLWIRVHAGRRLITEGNDFLALQTIRSGEWSRLLQLRQAERARDRRGDGVSRVLVTLGEVVVILFGVLMLTAWLPSQGQAGGVVTLGVVLLLWRLRGLRLQAPMRGGNSPVGPPEVVR